MRSAPATIRRDGQFAKQLDALLDQSDMQDQRWQLLGGDVKLNRGAVKKLSVLKGKELKKQMEHLLKEGKLPRKKQEAEKGSPKERVKTQVASFVERLKTRDEKLPVAALKEMAALLGFKLVDGRPAKKPPKTKSQEK